MTYLEHKDDGGAGLPCGDNWKPPPGVGNDKQVRRRFFKIGTQLKGWVCTVGAV
jgi:hypothetical protein